MFKFTDIHELPYTTEELEYFESEMRKYKVPLIYKWVFGSLYKWGRFFMPILFLIILGLGIVHMSTNLDLWNVIKIFALFWIFFIGGFVLISWVWHRLKVLKECKRLGIKLYEWNIMVIAFQISYI